MSLEIDYNWNFNPLECYPTESGYTDVVFKVHWQLYASTGSYGASSIGVQSIGPLGSGSFTPYEDLTKDQVFGWVTSSMNQYNSSSVDNLYASLAVQIENQINPPVINLPAPWITPFPSPSATPTITPTPTPTPSALPE